MALGFGLGFGFLPQAWGAAPAREARIVAEWDHDPSLFTQALFFDGQDIVESAGLYGRSRVIRYRPGGQVLAEFRPGAEFFAEGAALVGDEIYVLTWREGVVFILDAQTLTLKKTLFLPRESWGLTFDGTQLWRSDGSAQLWPHQLSLAAAGRPVTVRDGDKTIKFLNELERDPQSGLILANIFGQTRVAFIEPRTGTVKFYLDCQKIAKKYAPKNPEAVLNGLALDPAGRLFLTGKLWPRLFQVDWDPIPMNGAPDLE
jgi:glutamine cyclotransferase